MQEKEAAQAIAEVKLQGKRNPGITAKMILTAIRQKAMHSRSLLREILIRYRTERLYMEFV